MSGHCRGVGVVDNDVIMEDAFTVWRGQNMLVKRLRTQRSWSQEQLAEYSGLSVRTIQRVESGNKASLETLKCLCI